MFKNVGGMIALLLILLFISLPVSAAKVDNEFPFQPTAAQIVLALSIQRQLTPSPRIEFIAQPAGMFDYTFYLLRLTNPANSKYEDYSIEMTMRNPGVTLVEAAAIGLSRIPAAAAIKPVVIEPDTAMRPPAVGEVGGMFGPSKPAVKPPAKKKKTK